MQKLVTRSGFPETPALRARTLRFQRQCRAHEAEPWVGEPHVNSSVRGSLSSCVPPGDVLYQIFGWPTWGSRGYMGHPCSVCSESKHTVHVSP